MSNWSRLFRREQVLTIPNAMSLFRLLLIPAIVITYVKYERSIYAVALVALSALTDIADGVVARKFNMCSDLGKILDPVADKLTQGAIIICLALRYREILILFALMFVKELAMTIVGSLLIKRHSRVIGARWYGKLCTTVLEISFAVLMLFGGIQRAAADALIAVCCAVVALSMVLYLRLFISQLTSKDAP